MYVRPSISGSIKSPEPKCLSSLLLEALLERVLLLEWLEFLSPVWSDERGEGGEGDRNTADQTRLSSRCKLFLTAVFNILSDRFTHQATSHVHVSLTEVTACFFKAIVWLVDSKREEDELNMQNVRHVHSNSLCERCAWSYPLYRWMIFASTFFISSDQKVRVQLKKVNTFLM